MSDKELRDASAVQRILSGAADLVARGWARNDLAADKKGRAVYHLGIPVAARYSLVGAIYHEAGLDNDSQREAAIRIVHALISRRPRKERDLDDLFRWNKHQPDSAPVVTLLRRAARVKDSA